MQITVPRHWSSSSSMRSAAPSIPDPTDLFAGDDKSATWSEWMLHIEPVMEFPLPHLSGENKRVVIDQNSRGYGELGSRVWDAGVVLSHWIVNCWKKDANFWKNKAIIELGSGTGLTGIVAALHGADILLTDQKSLLRLLQHNVDKNVKADALGKAKVSELFWGKENPFGRTFDIVLGADLTYDFEDLEPLVQTCEMLTQKGALVYIAYGKERAAAPTFLELISRSFTVEHVPDTELPNAKELDLTFTIGIVKLTRK